MKNKTTEFYNSNPLKVFFSYYKPHWKIFALDLFCAMMISLIDIAFPIVHGTNVEDGTMAAFFNLLGIPYVGPDILASSIGMDKIAMKKILKEYKPDCLIIEDTQEQGNVKTVITLARLQGMIIGYSGEANVSPELGNHLHFELYYQGSVVNPLDYYDKLIGELE